jgi:hypothetical protein
MPVAILLSNTFANALLQHSGTAVIDQLGGGSLVMYAGTPPAGPNEALSGNTVLGTWTFLTAASWSAPGGGSVPLAFTATTITAVATGIGTFFRFLSSGAAALVQGTVAQGSGGDWNLNNTQVTLGDNLTVTGSPTIAWTTT